MIYVNSAERVTSVDVPFVPSSGTIEVIITSFGMEPVEYTGLVTATPVGAYTRLSFTMPLSLCTSERELDIHWGIPYVEDTVQHTLDIHTQEEVVTPILSTDEIRAIHPNGTPDEIIRIEKAVRYIINAHCGQTFGRYVGALEARGNDTDTLLLPQRLVSLDKVNGTDASLHWAVLNDGWALRHFPWGVPPVKADYFGLHEHTGGVIHNPNMVKLGQFSRAKTFTVEGTWGWSHVPLQVAEAARLLINDYACGDIQYRDRYLTSMTAADWRIQFNNGAFSETGNVRADQLLADYVVKYGWTVV